ncbi:retrovirus-related Pol polyprotein from transposon 17.6 [Trichonephila clavipes]|nr:retrovirus-related Pol polyprotein from transposon 17.6 [Trichonephila clavipes]
MGVFKCFYCGIEGHPKIECRKKLADQRSLDSPRFRRTIRGRGQVFRPSRIQPVNQRRVSFSDSAADNYYATPRSIQSRYPYVPRGNALSPISNHDQIFDLPIVDASSQNYRFKILIDGGASVSLISNSLFNKIKDEFSNEFNVSIQIKMVSGDTTEVPSPAQLLNYLLPLRSIIEFICNNAVKCPIYKIPFNLRNEFRRHIADLEKAGIISKSKSQYNTPALFVKQKEKWRLVLDFRKLNEITLTHDFAIPTLDDILHEVSGANYFSALDMKSAFNQIPLHFRVRHKTAFSTPDGDKYEFNQLRFGLKNSPKAFQSIAQEVLGDLLHNGALVYIDDIILFIKTIDGHFELLGKVLERFERIQLKFNPGKCQFLTKSCKFLGFVVTPEGILIDKDKSISINEFPVPTDQKQIKSFFIESCNFYRRYIKKFAKRALPLTNLLRKDTPFEWTCETQAAFDDIKEAILNPPVLALPDPDAELQITTDASSHGIGVVLEQKYPNSEVKPIYFFKEIKSFAI